MRGDDSLRRYVVRAVEREQADAQRLLDAAEQSETVGEAKKLAHEATRHTERAEAYLDVLALVGTPKGDD